MNASSSRRALLTALALGTAVTAASFSLILNKTQPPPNGTGLPVKWPAGTVQLRIMLGETANLSDGSSFNQSARTAAETWNGVMGAVQIQSTLTTGSATQDNDVNELAFAAKVFGRDFDSNTLAVTTGFQRGNERVESDVIFNTAYTWDSYRGSTRQGVVDLQRVALHEIGHILGLDHPDEAGQTVDAIMNSRIGSRYQLSADDTDGVQVLYGPPGAPANDNFSNAAVLRLNASPALVATGYNTNATKEAADPRQGDSSGGRSVWWRWTAPSEGTVTLDTRGSYFDTTLGVYTGATLAGLSRVADNDDIDPGVVQASKLTFNATAGTEYRIMVDGFNNDDGTGADNAGLTLNLSFSGSLGTAPAITTQPASQTVTAGGSVSFTVAASGTAPLAYQWYLNNAEIAGATGSTYSISNVTGANAGSYHVVVSNQAGSVTSNTATLTVNPAPAPAPAPSSGGGGGGGGAASGWFVAVLALLAALRRLGRNASA